MEITNFATLYVEEWDLVLNLHIDVTGLATWQRKNGNFYILFIFFDWLGMFGSFSGEILELRGWPI